VIVVDASAIVSAIAAGDERSGQVRERLGSDDELAAPHLIDLEVLQALRRLARRGELSSDRAVDSVRDLAELVMIRYPHEPFIDRLWELRDSLSAYDAAYVALAEAISIPLITCDAGLAAIAERTVTVELFSPVN
jgi:predicted nucleic acid-binding protein